MTWLAVIAILNSALSLFYYARLVKYMYFMPPLRVKRKRSVSRSHMQQPFWLQLQA